MKIIGTRGSGLGTRGASPDALAPSPEPPYLRPHMALALTPRLLRRGLELFAVISLIGVGVVLVFFGENLETFVSTLGHLRWGWLLLGLGLASMDWVGGGTRLWVVARHVHPRVRWRDMVIAGGRSARGPHPPAVQTGARPPVMWAVRPPGVRPPPA